ncbi:MAG: sodium-dependent transporter [Euryarchaeota archaeon]|nr:sodium-dependent transporter [Euryarchaeota archaeon]
MSEQWAMRRGFILAAIGSAIGLGNVWRFSWLCYKNGGGAFLIPYFIALLLLGLPLLTLELMLGHKFASSPPKMFRKINHSFEFVGWLAVINVLVIGTYYAVVLAWVMDYIGLALLNSFSAGNASSLFTWLVGTPALVIAALLLTWLAVWYTLYRGVSAGIEKACTIAIPVLWVLSILLVVRGITLPGADTGINWYLSPDWSALGRGEVWIDALGQTLFTLSIMAGPMIVYASYLPKKSEIPNSAWIITFANSGFSFFFGFATWGIIGYLMAMHHVNNPADLNVPLNGQGLAFVTIPTAVGSMPGGALTAILFGTLFFLTLWLAGYTSLMSNVEPMYAALRDKFHAPRKKAISAIVLFSLALGVVLAFAPHAIDPVDFIAGTINLIWVVFVEVLIAGYYFGVDKLREFVNPYAEYELGKWYDYLILFVVPVALLAILGYGLMSTAAISPVSFIVLLSMVIAAILISGKPWKGGDEQ